MNRENFLSNLFKLYPPANQQALEIWHKAYKQILPESGINYERLFNIMLREYGSTKTAPAPAWFYERLKTVEIKQAEQHEEIKGCVPPPADMKEQLKKYGFKVVKKRDNDENIKTDSETKKHTEGVYFKEF